MQDTIQGEVAEYLRDRDSLLQPEMIVPQVLALLESASSAARGSTCMEKLQLEQVAR